MNITTLDEILPILASVIYNEAEFHKIKPEHALSKVILGSLVTTRHVTTHLELLGNHRASQKLIKNTLGLGRYSPVLALHDSKKKDSDGLTIIPVDNLNDVEAKLAEMLECHFKLKRLDPKYPGLHRHLSLMHQADFWLMRQAA